MIVIDYAARYPVVAGRRYKIGPQADVQPVDGANPGQRPKTFALAGPSQEEARGASGSIVHKACLDGQYLVKRAEPPVGRGEGGVVNAALRLEPQKGPGSARFVGVDGVQADPERVLSGIHRGRGDKGGRRIHFAGIHHPIFTMNSMQSIWGVKGKMEFFNFFLKLLDKEFLSLYPIKTK
jgi:hypothetical protein